MRIQDWLTNHTHYWGVPHMAEGDGRLVHVCYDCGKQRESILGESILEISPASEQPDVSKQPGVVSAEGKLAYAKN